MSTPRTLQLPPGTTALTLVTERATHAAIESRPAETGGTVVFVPGFTGSKEDFVAVLAPITDAGFRVVAFDQRGQFESPAGDSHHPVSVDSLANDLLAVVATVADDEPVHVVGHSFGGLVVRSAVLHDPTRFASLTLMCSGPGALPDDAHPMLSTLEQALHAAPIEAVWQAKEALDRANGLALPDPEIHEFLHHRFISNDPQALASKAVILREEPDRSHELAQVVAEHDLPTLVLYGENDDAWPVAEQRVMASVLGARVEVIAMAGHSPAVDEPIATAAALLSFWASAGTAAHDVVADDSRIN